MDDLSDLGLDIRNRKHNYLAALIVHGRDSREKELLRRLLEAGDAGETTFETSLYRRFPKATRLARTALVRQFDLALEDICGAGFPLGKQMRKTFVATTVRLLGHPNLLARIRG